MTVVLFDVDGVINVLDHPVTHMLRDNTGKPVGYIDFDPKIGAALRNFVSEVPGNTTVAWMSCWNAKTAQLPALGFPDLPFVPVDRADEQASKIGNLNTLTANGGHIIWVDDFSAEWLPTAALDHPDRVHAVHIGRNGLTISGLRSIQEDLMKLQSRKEP